jgi:hypothetical protein
VPEQLTAQKDQSGAYLSPDSETTTECSPDEAQRNPGIGIKECKISFLNRRELIIWKNRIPYTQICEAILQTRQAGRKVVPSRSAQNNN